MKKLKGLENDLKAIEKAADEGKLVPLPGETVGLGCMGDISC